MGNIQISDLQMDKNLDDGAMSRIFGGATTTTLINQKVREELVGYIIQDGEWFKQVSDVYIRVQEIIQNPVTEPIQYGVPNFLPM